MNLHSNQVDIKSSNIKLNLQLYLMMMSITYIKRRMKLPFNPNGQWLRTVAKYSETCTWLPEWFVPLQR
jgi:hypothetical protein